MIRKAGFLLIAIVVIGVIYYSSRKKKNNTYNPANANNVADTSAALGISEEASALVDERRTNIVARSDQDTALKPVETVTEQLTYNGKSYPILGYAKESSKNQTLVLIPVEFAQDFTTYPGGKLSKSIKGTVQINTGKYAGTHKAWYIYVNETSSLKNANIYIDATWKD